ncbi:hypothetical protein LCGC14_1004550 [marine sediment metagenome]
MMISCKKAALICNKVQYREATFLERLKLKFHLFVCKNCPEFSRQNSRLTSLCQQADLRSLSETDKKKMKEILKEEF